MPDFVIDDSGDAPVATGAPEGATDPQPEPEAPAPAAEEPEVEVEDPEPQDDDDEPMTMAQARKLRRENQQLRQERKADRDRLAELDRQAMTEHERAIEAAREETAAEYKKQMAQRDLLLAAKGRLQNPEDAQVFIATDDPDEDFEAAIDALLEARPYLGVESQGPAQVEQGARKSKPKSPGTLQELMQEAKQRRGGLRL